MRKPEHNKLRALSVEELIAIREEADGLIRRRLPSEKKNLQAKLARIVRYESRTRNDLPKAIGANRRPKRVKQMRAKVAPKYQNPESGQTWAGRGLQPRWLREAIAAGKTASDFLISGAAAH